MYCNGKQSNVAANDGLMLRTLCLPFFVVLVQNDVRLVSLNMKLAQGLQTVKNLVFGLRYAG
jgi:hypothetical protein